MEEQKTIKDLSITELKAIKSDNYEKIQEGQNIIAVINQELSLRQVKPEETPVLEEEEKEEKEEEKSE